MEMASWISNFFLKKNVAKIYPMALLSLKKILFVHLIQLLLIVVIGKTGYVNNHDKDGKQSQGKSVFGAKKLCKSGFCTTKSTRYILYDVNRGEGFNLRRDIYVRIAPLVKLLNERGNHSQWILVLPPWGRLAHWTGVGYFGWKTFFDLNEIQKYIPAIDFEEFLDEYGLDNPIDVFYQLEHFPIDSIPSKRSWSENVKACDTPLVWTRDSTTGLYIGKFWKYKLQAKNASCLALKGQSSDIVNYILKSLPEESESQSILIDRAEVILWDHYGGKEWWRARLSLQFAQNLIEIAVKWVSKKYPTFSRPNLKTSNYLAVHLRRGDFTLYKNDLSLIDVANQIVKAVLEFDTSNVFIATDGTEQDIKTIKRHAATITKKNIIFDQFDCLEHKLYEGECAIIDQIISSWSKYFIGTADSTFTFRIFEEREILQIDPKFNYHLFCTGGVIACPKSTRWPIQLED